MQGRTVGMAMVAVLTVAGSAMGAAAWGAVTLAPEPATLAFLLVGAAGLLAARRRRRG